MSAAPEQLQLPQGDVRSHRASLAVAAKIEGLRRADAAADPEWITAWDAAIGRLARAGEPFTSEDVRAIAGPPETPNAAGGRFAAAARQGRIRRVGYRLSTRPSLHRHPLSLWIGAA